MNPPLPPGFRFHPTDEELVVYYLKRKVSGRSIQFNIITDIDLYKQEPWDLPEKSFILGTDTEWYFFSPRDKKYPNGLRTNRATEAGYWKATGKDRNVKKTGRVVGMKKTLVFYRGRAPNGERTDWVMHEYRLGEEECEKVHASQDLFVLCRVFKKSGVGPRSGEDRGPQTYVDDDVIAEPPAGKTVSTPLTSEVEAPHPEGVPQPPEAEELVEAECQPEAAEELVTATNPAIPTPSLSVDDYAAVDSNSDVIDMPNISFEDYILEEPVYSEVVDDVEDVQFWDCFGTLGEDLEPIATSAMGFSVERPSGELLEGWQVDRIPALESNLWIADVNALSLQDAGQESGGDFSFLGILHHELLDADDMLPGLEEELESYNPGNLEARGHLPGAGPDAADRALQRAARPRVRQAPAEAQRGRNSVANRTGSAPRQRMFNTNFRGPEVPSAIGENSSTQSITWPAPPVSGPVHGESSSYDSNLPLPSTNGLYSDSDDGPSAPALSFGNPDASSSEFHEFFFEFDAEEEPIPSSVCDDDNNFGSTSCDSLVNQLDSVDATASQSPDKLAKSSHSSASDGLFKGERILDKAKPLSKPFAGLMNILGSFPVLPASAAEFPPDLKRQKSLQVGAVVPSFSSIHVSAVTVTCTCSPGGTQQVQAAVTDICLQRDVQGVFQQVVAGSWQSIPTGQGVMQQGSDKQKRSCANCNTPVVGSGLQRRVVRGSNSGFVFAFVLGCWFLLLIHGFWKLLRHGLMTVF